VIVELVYKVCHANPNERARFIRCIYNLLNSSSAAVRYEAAGTLVTLSSSPTAIKVIIANDGRGTPRSIFFIVYTK
jgi:coatomer subunit beta